MTSIDAVEQSKTNQTPSGLALPVFFTATIFLSASLLFFVQPLFAKMVLPQIGGAPAVWTTAMLFFQMVLLAGYLYAHLLTHHVAHRWQLPVHLAFWFAALLFLPLSISPAWTYDPQVSTTWQTLTLFAVGVGVPFAMLSANAPLLQSWYARTNGPSAKDPYFLYGASNTGSLLALLGFPLIAEPLFGAQSIGWAWMVVFIVFGGFLSISGVLALRNAEPAERPATDKASSRVSLSQIGTWLLLAFVPSSLMLAVTTKVSTDMGSFPLIWVIPLALYILSFVVTFTNRPIMSDRTLAVLGVAALAVMTLSMSHQVSGLSTWARALIFAPALFLLASIAHRKLYNLRPDAAHLTVFYITMSVGGALGGLFNSIVAPAVFTGVSEGWISVLCAAVVGLIAAPKLCVRSCAYGVLIAAVTLFGFAQTDGNAYFAGWMEYALMAGFTVGLLAMASKPHAILSAVAVFLITDAASLREDYLFKDRSFFGAHRVYDKDGLRIYGHGTTVHGIQRADQTGQHPTPLSYYHPQSPMAQVLTRSQGIEAARVAIVGLGVGSLACYRQPGQSWEFYEIDQMVDQVARDPAMFNFMSHCAPGSSTHLGDARIVLAKQDYTFDIMVLDAYSSDAIPLHLLTKEAVQVYLDRLANDGQLVFHISNRYYDLRQPLARIARELGLHAVIRVDQLSDTSPDGARASVVVTLSPDQMRAQHLIETGSWSALKADSAPAWTDDRANLLSALRR